MKRLKKQGLNPASVRFFDEPLKKPTSPIAKSNTTFKSSISLSHDPVEGEETTSPSPTGGKGSRNHKSNIVWNDDPVEVTASPTSNSATYKTTFQLG